MKVRQKQIVKKVKKDAEANKRGPVTLYLHLGEFAAFKSECERQGLAASAVIEEMIRQFLNED